MRDAGVPAGPVYDTNEVWDDDHVTSRTLLSEGQTSVREFPAIDHP
jgi:crotonobetainyl-CoA:carnitine CoA-transferase CaiB-like acyl-CoA transferase